MAVFTLTGRAALVGLVAREELMLAWGRGSPAWDDMAAGPPVDAAGLVDEVGRMAATNVGFAQPDPDGDIMAPSGRYTLSATPTRYLYLRFPFAFADAASETLRECGVFLDTELVPGLPESQRYFEPADVADQGTLVVLERFPAFERNENVRQTFETVLPF